MADYSKGERRIVASYEIDVDTQSQAGGGGDPVGNLGPTDAGWPKRFCGQCGHPIAQDYLFCTNCGKRLRAAAAVAQSPHPTLSMLLPLPAWFAEGSWRRGLQLALLLFGLAPWMLLKIDINSFSIWRVSWGFSIYFAILWAAILWTIVRPGRLPARLVVAVILNSCLVGVPLAIILEEHFFHSGGPLWSWVLGVGLPEELAKALPVLVVMYRNRHRQQWSPRLYMYMGIISGLAFGTIEAVEYVGASLQSYGGAVLVTSVVWRLLTDSLFHALTAAIIGYFIGLAAMRPEWKGRFIGFGLGITALLHGLNDRYAGSWTQVAVAGALLFIFLGYVRDGHRIEAAFDIAPTWGETNASITTKGLVGNSLLTAVASVVLIVTAVTMASNGTNGNNIVPGTSGTSGTSGTPGVSGTSGVSGVSTGAVGTSGVSTSGTTGTPGPTGTSGSFGPTGTGDSTGTSGNIGPSGISGITGASGSVGASGPSGPSGPSGTAGPSGGTDTSGASGPSGG